MMKKTLLLIVGLMFLLPLVSAIDEPNGLDLYYLFVENIFGGFIWATLGFVALFVVFGMLSRMSATLLIMLLSLFIMVSLIQMAGMSAVFIFFAISAYYFIAGIVKWVTSMN